MPTSSTRSGTYVPRTQRRVWTVAGGLLAAWVSVGCVDTGLNPRTDRDDPDDETDITTNPRGDVDTFPPRDGEYCNGLDDDGDGQVDEGFEDIDQDGAADCVDKDCVLSVPPAGTVRIDPVCRAEQGAHDRNPWDVVVEWRWEGLTAREDRENTGFPQSYLYDNILMAPIVGNMTDDDLNGRIDDNDMPDVVTVAFVEPTDKSGYLVILDGETGLELLRQPGWLPFGGVVVADIDQDGLTEIVGFDSASLPRAIRGDGSEVWRGNTPVTSTYPQATVADLDADGTVEVLADNQVLDGPSGRLLFSAAIDDEIIGRMPAIGDVDLNGLQDFVLGRTIYEFDRNASPQVRTGWTTPVKGTYGHWTAILDANGDQFGEVAMIGGGRLVIHRHDGPVLVDVAAGTDQPGPPCVADFDGDGVSEIAWGSSDSFNVYNLDGSKVWSFPMSDQSGLAGCSGYDVDGDGDYEVLFADEQAFYIFDGRTGRILYGNMGHASGTVFEYPVVADLDRDGSAEIVIASSNYRLEGWSGITVFGHISDNWQRSGPTWHVHDFAVTNIDEDGAVPRTPEPSWQRYNVYRARPTINETFVDLQVAFADVCFSGCKGDKAVAKIAVQVLNTGASNSRSEVPLALYARNGDLLELLAVRRLPNRVPAGGVSPGVVFTIPATSFGPDGILVRVNDDGTDVSRFQEECDYDNNTAVYDDTPCPTGGAE